MDIKKLQGELVEKISLVSIGDDGANVERALEIINQLGEDHINDTITIDSRDLTALDCVIVFDSQGNNPRISERARINNSTLKELENAIRNVGGKTSEELGLIQNIPYDQSEFHRVLMYHLENIQRDSNRRMTREVTRELFHLVLGAGSGYLAYTSRNDEEFSMSRYLTGMIGMGAFLMLKMVQIREVLRELTLGEQERQASTNVENATVQPNIEERQPSLG